MDRDRAAPRTSAFDAQSIAQLRLFGLHLAIIGLFSLPSIVLQPFEPQLVLSRLSAVLSISALTLALIAMRHGLRLSPASLGLWDEVAALSGLSMLCFTTVRLMAGAVVIDHP